MTTQGRINPETLSAFLEGLPDLLESLRAQGYGLGTRQHVAAHELVGSLFAHGGLPPTLLGLDEWLAPLICSTPAQQDDFRDRYLQWLIEKGLVDKVDLPAAPPPVPVPPPPPPTPEPSAVERIVRWLHTNRRLLIVSGAVLVAAAVLFIAYQLGAAYLKNEDLTQVVVLDPPVPQPTPVPTPFDVNDNDIVEVASSPPSEPASGLAWDVDKTVEVTPSPTPTPPPLPPPGFWVNNFSAVVALTLVMPFAGLGLWHILGRRRRRRDAERWRDERPRYDKIKVRGARERVFQSAALRPIARGLRHYLSVESRQLDARSTVRASVGRGGLFTPVYGRRRTLPEYLVLIDRVGFGDQLAQFNSDIVARLGEHDVYLDTYYFHGDPRRCREGGADSPQLSLSDLAARHPDHYLLIFSDGTGLMSTTTGRPEPFVEQLQHWRGRALLTPVPRLEWEYREWALEREGLKVLPASNDGLRTLVEAVNTGARSVRAPGFDETPPYPDILREQPTLWKERDEPPPHQTRRLSTHLRRYLGPAGFELLCACAVYPVMQWGVTLFLAYELLGRSKVDEVLPRLLRLPWFRNGTMPQWLRRVLIRQLPRARRRLVRERLEHLLLTFLEDPERGLRPRSAEEQAAQDTTRASLMTRISERLAAWRRSRQLRRRLQHVPARSPLAEPVFLNYITDNRRTQALPPAVRHKLFRRGVAAFGLRLAPAAALVAVAVFTGLLLLLLQRPTDNIYTPGAPKDLCAHLCPSQADNSTDPDFTYTPTSGKLGETVNVTVRVVKPGKYDLRKVQLVYGIGVNWMTEAVPTDAINSVASTDPESLSASLRIDQSAPIGPTQLRLFEGSRLRALLPFNITATAATAPTPTPAAPRDVPIAVPVSPCPLVSIMPSGEFSRDPNAGVLHAKVGQASSTSAVQAGRPLTYTWSANGGVSIYSGQGTPDVVVRFNDISLSTAIKGLVTVTVGGGGWPASCANSDAYAYANPPNTPQFIVSVEPQSVTVCQSNPKLNDPPSSRVNVKVSRVTHGSLMKLHTGVSAGTISDSGSDSFVWNLSGVLPGTYSVSVSPYQRAPNPPTTSAKVTVNGCPGSQTTLPGSRPAQLSDTLKALTVLGRQAGDLSRLKSSLAKEGELTSAENTAIGAPLSRLKLTIFNLNNKLNSLSSPPDAKTRSELISLLGAISSALDDLNAQALKVKNDDARNRLNETLKAMRPAASQLKQSADSTALNE
ncbi:MAG: hypothetical protein QOH49_2708 [Acidobacteriota bacterium]|jgi:hypothetical protein|nr:hypothetical protein [Acidobacteriota bacterium]